MASADYAPIAHCISALLTWAILRVFCMCMAVSVITQPLLALNWGAVQFALRVV